MIKKTIVRICSLYGFFPLISCFIYNMLVYTTCNILARNWTLHDLSISIDYRIPVIYCSILIYLLCYIFWAVNYVIIFRRSREYAYRFFTAEFISRTVCLLFFVFYPTTIERPVIEGSSFCAFLMKVVYTVDAPVNLFPSIHCLVSWNCFIGIRKDSDIPLWYKIFSLVFALMVCVSTLTTKQHVFADVFGGILLAELSYFISGKINCVKLTAPLFDKLAGVLK